MRLNGRVLAVIDSLCANEPEKKAAKDALARLKHANTRPMSVVRQVVYEAVEALRRRSA